MKKIILAIMFFNIMFSYSQDKVKVEKMYKEPQNKMLSITANVNGVGFYGVSFEKVKIDENKKLYRSSTLLNLNYATTTADVDGLSYRGGGFCVESGQRIYFKYDGLNDKFYIDNLYNYTRVEFSDSNYKGVYDYFSILNLSLGYKFVIGKHFVIDPSAGFIWKLEIKGKGDVNNKSFDNVVPKYGVKIGYKFL